MEQTTVGLISLGCAKNLIDSEVMIGHLAQAGMVLTPDPELADVLIVNTCSFIDMAKQESIDAIFGAVNERSDNPERAKQKIIVAGCLSQRFAKDLPGIMPEVDAFIGLDQITKVAPIIRNLLGHDNASEVTKDEGPAATNDPRDFVTLKPKYVPDYTTPRFRLTPDHYAYVKIAEGCNHTCTFCIIPKIRGTHRSRTQESVLREVEALVKSGVKEINLISQDTTYFGMDQWEGQRPNPSSPVDSSKGNSLNPKLAKWHYWLMDAWPAPHEVNRLPGGHKVGAFEGGAYQSRGVYRPEAECLMRMGDKYCVVCFEHVEKRFYRLIAPIDDARPRRALVGLWGDESTVLEGDAIRTIASGGQAIGKFEGFWYVDGKPRSASAKNLTTALTLQGSELSAGTHEAALRVDFSNKRVRRDDGWLSSSIGWKLDVVKHKRPKWDGPEKVPGRIGQPVVFEMKIENPDSQLFRVEVHAIPEGATYDGVRFTWTPEKIHQGAWRPRFVLTDGLRVVERAVEIAVLDTSEKNFEPIVALMEARSLTEGEKSEVLLDVVDVDGDNLVFTSPNLPEGAQLDVYEGVIRWTPSPRQAGKYPGVVVEVSDGRRKMKGTIDLIVEDKPSANFSKDNLLDALRAPGAGLRKRALEELGSGDWAKSFQFLEAARLLRDKDKEIRGDALATLQKLEGEAEAVFLSMMIRDLEPHVWHFTDHKETLKWLEALASKVPAADADGKALRGSLKAIDRYNKERGF